jgi:hypothetical protein
VADLHRRLHRFVEFTAKPKAMGHQRVAVELMRLVARHARRDLEALEPRVGVDGQRGDVGRRQPLQAGDKGTHVGVAAHAATRLDEHLAAAPGRLQAAVHRAFGKLAEVREHFLVVGLLQHQRGDMGAVLFKHGW